MFWIERAKTKVMKVKGYIFGVLALATVVGAAYILIGKDKKKDEEEDANFGGEVLAENNVPFGQYFKDPVGITIRSNPFYKRA
jgi:hypothetical protein